MAKAVNQNDLIDIIKSQVDSLGDIMTVVFKAVRKNQMQVPGQIQEKMRKFQENLELVFGDKGVISVISQIRIDNIKPITRKDRRKVQKTIKSIVKLVKNIVKNCKDMDRGLKKDLVKIQAILKPLKSVLQIVQDMIDMIKKFKIKDIISIWWKSKIIIRVVKQIKKLISRISRIFSNVVSLGKANVELQMVATTLGAVSAIVSIVRGIRTFLIAWKIRKISKILRPLQRLIRRIGRIRGVRKAMVKAFMIKGMINAIKDIVITLIILVPLLAVFTLLAPLLLIGILVLVLVLKAIQLLLRFLGVRTVIAFTVLGLIVILICLVAMGLIVLGILSVALMGLLEPIALFFLAFLAIILIMALIGLIMKPLSHLLTSFLTTVGKVVLIIMAMVFIAGMLKLLEMIDLDAEKVKANVKKVISCVFSLVEALFESSYELMGGSEEDGPIKKLFLALVGGFAAYYSLMAMSKILVYAVIVVAIVMVIAGSLWLIQKMDIDPEKVKTNVKAVMDTCQGIINSLFFGEYDQPQPAKDGWQKEAIKYGAGLDIAFAKVIGAILAIVYVAAVAVAIILLLVLAGMLWLIQKIDIDPESVRTSVKNIFECCEAALDACMGADKKPDREKSPDTYVEDLIAYNNSMGTGIGSMLVSIVQAILAIVYVAIMVIAILLILVLASLLWTLGKIDINPKDVNRTVNNVFDCCSEALNACCGYGYKDDNEEADKPWLLSLLQFVGRTLTGPFTMIVNIFQAIISILYVAIMIIAILLILVLAGLLKALEVIPLDRKKIEQNIQNVIGACGYANDSVGGTAKDPGGGQSQSWWEKIMQWGANLLGGLGNIISALISIVFIAISIVSILLILILAGLLKALEAIPLDDEKIKKNIDTTIGSAVHVATGIARAKSNQATMGEGSGGGILDWLLPADMIAIAQILKSIAFMAIALVAVGLIKILAELLQPLAKIELDDQSIKRNSDIVLGCAAHISEMVSHHINLIESKKDGDKIDFSLVEDFNDYVDDYYKPMFTRINDLSKILYSLQTTVKNINREELVNNVKDIFGVVTDVVQYLNSMEFDMGKTERNLELLERTTDAIHKLGHVSNEDVQNSKQITDNYIKFLDKINSSDFQKLDIAAKMFESFAILAESIKGDFQGLAETVNEHIMPVLDETQKMLDELPGELEKAGDKIAQELEEAATAAGQRMAEALNSVTIQTDSMGGFEMDGSMSSPATTASSSTPSTNYQESSTRWKADSLQDIVDIMMGAGGGVRVRNS